MANRGKRDSFNSFEETIEGEWRGENITFKAYSDETCFYFTETKKGKIPGKPPVEGYIVNERICISDENLPKLAEAIKKYIEYRRGNMKQTEKRLSEAEKHLEGI